MLQVEYDAKDTTLKGAMNTCDMNLQKHYISAWSLILKA